MEFDKSRVYTAANADELKIGSKVICANCLANLKEYVADYFNEGVDNTCIIASILDETYGSRFQDDICNYPLAYLVSEPETWIVYINRHRSVKPYFTSCRSDRWEEVKKTNGAKTKLFEGSEKESDKWYTSRKHLADVIAAWEDGKDIQYLDDITNEWNDTVTPGWCITTKYRIKPEGLKWADLKIGDILHEKDGTETRMVTAIDISNEPDGDILHICLGDWWASDDELEDWEKVE